MLSIPGKRERLDSQPMFFFFKFFKSLRSESYFFFWFPSGFQVLQSGVRSACVHVLRNPCRFWISTACATGSPFKHSAYQVLGNMVAWWCKIMLPCLMLQTEFSKRFSFGFELSRAKLIDVLDFSCKPLAFEPLLSQLYFIFPRVSRCSIPLPPCSILIKIDVLYHPFLKIF